MNPLFAEAIGAFIRTGLAYVSGFIVSAGIWESGDADKYVVSLTAAILVLMWSVWQKYKGRIKLLTALGTVGATSEKAIEEKIKTKGTVVSPNTPKTVVPPG